MAASPRAKCELCMAAPSMGDVCTVCAWPHHLPGQRVHRAWQRLQWATCVMPHLHQHTEHLGRAAADAG
eukprot:365831-Chlamydomonas_euryale.AAC.4